MKQRNYALELLEKERQRLVAELQDPDEPQWSRVVLGRQIRELDDAIVAIVDRL